MTITNCQTRACFNAWVNCENLLGTLTQVKKSISGKLSKVVNECALICMGTFHALKSKSNNINRFAILCIGICEECAELCDGLNEKEFKECARLCRECSEHMTSIAFTNLQ